MGMDLNLCVTDNSIESTHLSRGFKSEIIFERHLKFKDFLTEDEINIISPNHIDYDENIERDPKELKETLLKVENQLQIRHDELPLIHFVYSSKDRREEVEFMMIEDIESYFEGDLYHYDNYPEVRNKIHVKSYNEDFRKIDFFIDVHPKIEILDKVFYTKTLTKAEEFKNEFQRCYDFLDEAISRNKKVLFVIG